MPNIDHLNEFAVAAGIGAPCDIDRNLGEHAPFFHAEIENMQRIASALRVVYPRLPDITFGWVGNHELGAWAFRHRGSHCIAITASSTLFFWSLFSRILSHPKCLAGVGDAGAEDATRVKPVPVSTHMLNRVSAGAAYVDPIDPVRRSHVPYFVRLSVNHLYYHELVHILHGHIGYLNDCLGMPYLPELGWAGGKVPPSLTIQAFEMDADTNAGSIAGSVMQTRLEGRGPDILKPMYTSMEQAVFNWAFAVSSFHRVFGDDSITEASPDKIYPPWRVRTWITIRGLIAFHARTDNPPDLVGKWWEVAFRGVEAAERAFEAITGGPRCEAGLVRAFNGEAAAYLDDVLLKHWAGGLRDDLLPFAFHDGLLS